MVDETPTHRRRTRYKGTHPRRFQEKYKELDPARYAEEQAKVASRGQTPAGTHRSIMVEEILEVLDPRPGQRFLDATLGYGGHSREILQRLLPEGHLTGLDVDPLEMPRTEARMRDLGFGPECFTARRMNFAGLPGLIPETGAFHGILADLGLSSMQIDNPERGFTFKVDAPLDLRLNPQRGRSAADLLASLDAGTFAELLVSHSDEPFADAIAEAVCGAPAPVRTTQGLARIVREVLADQGYDRLDPETRRSLQRTFQALRIEVNNEFGVLEQFLAFLPHALLPGAKVAILTFHSGEDRRVKKAFQEGLRAGFYDEIADSPLRASAEEQRDNPRSAPAKLRWARRSEA